MKPTMKQLHELHLQIEAGIATQESMEEFLERGRGSVPDTCHLRTFTIEVRGSDPKWRTIDHSRYLIFEEDEVAAGDFPVDYHDRIVTVALFPAGYYRHDPSNREIMAEMKRRRLKLPDRAVTETVFDRLKNEVAPSSWDCTVGICGKVRTDVRGRGTVGTIGQELEMTGLGSCRRTISIDALTKLWGRHGQFIAVVDEKPL